MNRYDNPVVETTPQNKPYWKGKSYPNIPPSESDVYVITSIGDRLDNLAQAYYNDSTLWWVIAMANNNSTKGFMYPEPGTQLRVPTNLNAVLVLFDNFNLAR
jgi:nucleoid-associated protein YgaU